jgi:Cytochrome P450
MSKAIYNIYLHPLASYPGSKLYTCSSIAWAYLAIQGNLYLKLAELHETYGPVVRVAPNILSYIDGSAWRDIHGLGPSKQELPKNPLFTEGQVGIFYAHRDAHQRIRGTLKNAFSVQAMKDQEGKILSLVDLLIQRLHENSKKGAVDISAWYNFVAFDIMGDLTFGENFRCLQDSKYHKW